MPVLTLTPDMVRADEEWLTAVYGGGKARTTARRKTLIEEASLNQLKVLALAVIMVLFKQIECSAEISGKVKRSKKRKYIKKYFGNISVAHKTLQDEHRLRQALMHIQGTVPFLLTPYFKC